LKDRSGLRIAVYLVFFLLLTAVLVFVNFPMDRVTEGINGRLETASGGAATVESAHFSLPLSLVLSNLSVKLNGKRLNVGDARVTPHLLSLVGSSRGADVVFAGPWGKLPVSFGTDNGGWSLEGGNDEIDLSLFPGVDGLPVDIVGNLSLSGKINIRLNEAVISGQTMEMFGVKPVNLNNIQTFMSVEKNLLTLGETKIEGDIMGEGRGTIRLIPSDIGKSRLDLTLNLRPSLEAREQLAPLFSLAGARKKPDSSLTVRIRGTIDQPQFSI
jgi:type II secretion system protein N